MINSGRQRNNDIIILSSSDLACVSAAFPSTDNCTIFTVLRDIVSLTLTVSEKPLKSSNMSQFKCQHVVGKEANKLNLERCHEEVIQIVERSPLFSKGN